VGSAGSGAGGGEQNQPAAFERTADSALIGTKLVNDGPVEINGHTQFSPLLMG
jgi:hypothetical protein